LRFGNSPACVCGVRSLSLRSRKFYRQGTFWIAAVVAAALTFGIAGGGASAPAAGQEKWRPKTAPCRGGGQAKHATPAGIAASPEDSAAQKELSELARNLRNAAPGSYEGLSAFATKHAPDTWGARAALALAYDDYQKNKAQQALVWLGKAKNETILPEY